MEPLERKPGPNQRLREALQVCRARVQVKTIQESAGEAATEWQRSPARNSVVEWIFERCRELGTCSKTPQLATNLLDVFRREMRQLARRDIQSVGAACLMIATKLLEDIDLNPAYASQLPGVEVDAATLVSLERGVLQITNWSIDLLTADEVCDELTAHLSSDSLPQRGPWDRYLASAYQSSAIRHGPVALAFAGALALQEETGPELKLCFEWAGVTQDLAERVLAEAPPKGESPCEEDADSTYSSSPDVKR